MTKRNPGEARCSKCKQFFQRKSLSKWKGILLCQNCKPQEAARTSIAVSRDEPKLDLRDE